MGDPESVRRKKLLFRAWNRGTREEGLLLGAFAERHLAGFDAGQLDRFEALLEMDDGTLYDWVAGRNEPGAEQRHDVTRMLLDFRYIAPSA
ncbi:MAG TPA: succinate dehydrogenase assembly factor 2 [Xanthobacteraceae bacterium]|jgi:antitoxin CptB|nr:succinate dehydrogenase assembly factor 2 [Xanthobacteraceae bacterium]